MSSLPPISTIHLFLPLHEALMDLLHSLKPKDWEKQTIAPLWKVKDVAAHLLDGHLRALSIVRDGYVGDSPEHINSYQDLVHYLNTLNATWVTAMKRVSPAVLMGMLAQSGPAYAALLASLPPHEKAIFGVAWAGEAESENWFHIAREYTEQWHHQQQIRMAVNQHSLLFSKAFYHPYLDTSMRALPHHYKSVKANPGDGIQFEITGEGGGAWFLFFDGIQWELVTAFTQQPACVVSIDGMIAWQIFTKGISRSVAEKFVRISGNTALGESIFSMLAVMA
jgi:hypothetical protein